MKTTFFKSASELRAWLEKNHAVASELWVGFYRKDSGHAGITYSEALDEALCFGWIDGVRRRVDEVSYANRFSPRRPRSIWSLVNTRRATELQALGRMSAAGLKALAARDPKRTAIYSFERPTEFDRATRRKFQADKAAWRFFQSQPPGYQRRAIWWIMEAKREETRAARLRLLMTACAQGVRFGPLSGQKKTA